jgi:uncharacterized protein (TIGR04255 family)
MKKTNGFPEVAEIHLPNAPLVKVLAQIRFEKILTIQDESSIAPFQDSIREMYPVFRTERTRTLINAAAGIPNVIEHPTVWKFSDIHETWKISLTSDFIAIETSAYSSRDAFLARFENVIVAFSRTLKPGVITRIGIRYIDRLTGDALAIIPEIVRHELVGLLAGSNVSQLETTASEALFSLGNDQLFARWALLPPRSTIDPNVLEPIDRQSWILDIDSSHSVRQAWDQDILKNKLKELSCTSYNFFRWAVTPAFLKFYGGKL